jgi:hypothetical protein
MAHISSISAAMFSDLSVCTKPHDLATFNLEPLVKKLTDGSLAAAGAGLGGATAAAGLFQTLDGTGTTTGDYIRISNIKEFPAIGTPANVVKVPEYGAKTSKQIQGQADSPTMELTLNFVPSKWAGNAVRTSTNAASGITIGDGKIYLMRFSLLNREPEGYTAITDAAGTSDLSISGDGGGAGALAGVQNSSYYFLGKFEALEVTPSLTDAVSAKLTITVQSDIRGAFTV